MKPIENIISDHRHIYSGSVEYGNPLFSRISGKSSISAAFIFRFCPSVSIVVIRTIQSAPPVSILISYCRI